MLRLGSGSSCYASNGTCIRRFYFFLRLSTSATHEGNPCSSSSSLAHFLVNSLGFSYTLSLSTSAKLPKNWHESGAKRVFAEKANSVVHFFKQLGFQPSDVRKIVSLDPRILLSRVDKTLKPKIKLLRDLGISEADLLQVVVKNPSLILSRTSPAIRAFRTVLGSDENVVRILKRLHWVNFRGAADCLIPNVELLQTYCGIPDCTIQKYILQQPKVFTVRTDLLRDMLIRVEQKLGIPRDSAMFLYGIQLVSFLSEKNIEDKCAIFKSFGWTQSDVMELIKRNPLCLTSAEASIKERLGFLMNQLGYNPTYLASRPSLFTCSIKKRLLPRHHVLQILKEKGLLRMNYLLATAAVMSESQFLKRFVLPFEEVHQVYAQLTGFVVRPLTMGGTIGHSPVHTR